MSYRPPRFQNNIPAVLRRLSLPFLPFVFFDPFFKYEVTLVDISWQGFKLVFVTPPPKSLKGDLILRMILGTFDIYDPEFLDLKIQPRWLDTQHFSAGGTSVCLRDQDNYLLEKIIFQTSMNTVEKAI